MNSQLSQALKDLSKILSDSDILLSDLELRPYQFSTLGEYYTTPIVLLPRSIDQLSRCLAVANQYKVTVFPISGGRNHGYNSSSPLSQNTVVLDLKHLNRILEYSREFNYVVIEPGVTFAELYQFLVNQGSEHILSGFGGSSNSSVMGNALDRGTGKGLYGNRELASDVKEIVVADGTVIDLEDRHGSDDRTSKLASSIVGMDLGKLLYQSNLAVVTKMIYRLEPLPEYLLVASLSINTDKKLEPLLNRLKVLNRKRIIEPVFSIATDVRMMMGSGFLKRQAGHLDYTLKLWKENLRTSSRPVPGRWNSSFAIHCSCEAEVKLKTQLLRSHLEEICDSLSFCSLNKSEARTLLEKSVHNKSEINGTHLKFLSNLGFADNLDQQALYWDSPNSFQENANPVNDGCGFIFFAPKLPFSFEHFEKSLQMLTECATKYEMEIPVAFVVKTKELAYMVLPIAFHLADEESKKKAHQYYLELFQRFRKEGYFPYRMNSLSMPETFDLNSETRKLICKVKAAFDQNGILSPNRYH